MSKKLTDSEVEQIRQLLTLWPSMNSQENPYAPVKFDHQNFKIRTLRLNQKLLEQAEKYALTSPKYKSFNHLVETLIWRELGCSPEYLQTIATDQDQGQADKD